jgi:hypothetical protein
MKHTCLGTMADLRELDVNKIAGWDDGGIVGAVPCVTVLGYHAPGDGGGGQFYWEGSSREVENGGTVIVPASKPSAGRWKRLVDGPLSVRWFGAIGDDQSHPLVNKENKKYFATFKDAKAVYPHATSPDDELDWAAIQAAIHAAVAVVEGDAVVKGSGVVYIPAGIYYLNQPLQVGKLVEEKRPGTDVITLQGDGWSVYPNVQWGDKQWDRKGVKTPVIGSVLRQRNPQADALVRPNTPIPEKRVYRDLALLGPGPGPGRGKSTRKATSRGLVMSPPNRAAVFDRVDNVLIANFAVGVEAREVMSSTFVGLHLRGNVIGFRTAHKENDAIPTDRLWFNCNVLVNTMFESSSETALDLNSASVNVFYGGLLQANYKNGIVLRGGDVNVFEGFYCENNVAFQNAIRVPLEATEIRSDGNNLYSAQDNEFRHFRTYGRAPANLREKATSYGGDIRVLGGLRTKFRGGKAASAKFEIGEYARETFIDGILLTAANYKKHPKSIQTVRMDRGDFMDSRFTFEKGANFQDKVYVHLPSLNPVIRDNLIWDPTKEPPISVVGRFHTNKAPDKILPDEGVAIALSGVKNRGASYIAAIHTTINENLAHKDATDLTFWTGNHGEKNDQDPAYLQERLRITPRGNVGIGTASPARKLHIDDVMRLEPRASEPADPSEGDMWMDSSKHKLKVYADGAWHACWEDEKA